MIVCATITLEAVASQVVAIAQLLFGYASLESNPLFRRRWLYINVQPVSSFVHWDATRRDVVGLCQLVCEVDLSFCWVIGITRHEVSVVSSEG